MSKFRDRDDDDDDDDGEIEPPESIRTQVDLNVLRRRWETGEQFFLVQPNGHVPQANHEIPWEDVVEEAQDRLDDKHFRTLVAAGVGIGYLVWIVLPIFMRWWSSPMAEESSEEDLLGTTTSVPVSTCSTVSNFPTENIWCVLLMLVFTQVVFAWDWSPPEYPVHLDRAQSSFTVGEYGRRDHFLPIATMDMGPAAEAWEDSFPDTPIDSDDHIVEVNGLRGKAVDLIEEIRRSSTLVMKISCRGPFSVCATLIYGAFAALLGGLTALCVGFGVLGVIAVCVVCGGLGVFASNHHSPAWLSGHSDAAFRPGLLGGFCEPLMAILGLWLLATAVALTIFRQYWTMFTDPMKSWPTPEGGYILSPEGYNWTTFNFTGASCQVYQDCEAVGDAAEVYFGAASLAMFMFGALAIAIGEVLKLKDEQDFLLKDYVNLEPLTYLTSVAHDSPFITKLRQEVKAAKRGYGRGSEELLLWESGADPRQVDKVFIALEQSRTERWIHHAELSRAMWPFALQAFGFALWAPLGSVELSNGCLSVTTGVQRTLLGLFLNLADGIQDPAKVVEVQHYIGLILAVLLGIYGFVVVPAFHLIAPDFADRLPLFMLPVLFLYSVSVVSWPIEEIFPLADATKLYDDWAPHHEAQCSQLLDELTWEFWSPGWLACVDWAWVAMLSRVLLFAFYLVQVMFRSSALATKTEVSPQEQGRALRQMQAAADKVLDPLVVREGQVQEAAARFSLEVERRICAYMRPTKRLGM